MGQEERLELLEKELEAVKLQLARAQAVTEIANTMARYNYYHSGGRQRDCLDQFAMRTPGVAIEIAMWGQYHKDLLPHDTVPTLQSKLQCGDSIMRQKVFMRIM